MLWQQHNADASRVENFEAVKPGYIETLDPEVAEEKSLINKYYARLKKRASFYFE